MTVSHLDRDELAHLLAGASYERAFSRSAGDLERHADALASEREQVAEAKRRLLDLPVDERGTAVRGCRAFQSWALCELLIEECHQKIYAEAAEAAALADLAVTVAEELDGGHYGSGLIHDLRARAWAAVGTALRA